MENSLGNVQDYESKSFEEPDLWICIKNGHRALVMGKENGWWQLWTWYFHASICFQNSQMRHNFLILEIPESAGGEVRKAVDSLPPRSCCARAVLLKALKPAYLKWEEEAN